MPRRHAKNKGKVSEVIARPTRTSIQYGVALLIVGFYNSHVDHLTRNEKAVWLLIALAVVNAVWVKVENYFEVGLLRTVPPKKVDVVNLQDDPA